MYRNMKIMRECLEILYPKDDLLVLGDPWFSLDVHGDPWTLVKKELRIPVDIFSVHDLCVLDTARFSKMIGHAFGSLKIGSQKSFQNQ